MKKKILISLLSILLSSTSMANETLKSKLNMYKEDIAVQNTLKRLDLQELPTKGKFILVNLASQMLIAYEDGVNVMESKVVIGKARTKTPQLYTEINFVELNPTWSVPTSIARSKKYSQKLSSDPDYFKRNGFSIYQSESGTRFVQRPGENNALGQLKIGLKNSGNILLHGTNEPAKFENEIRAFSSGCVRVEKIEELGTWILGENVSEQIDAGKTVRKQIQEKIPVLIGYYTAWIDSEDKLITYNDVYGYDKNNSHKLDFRVDKPTQETKTDENELIAEEYIENTN